MPLLFAFTLFVSATLLFLVQPMVAKMILPLFGGSPAVWNSCIVFFQAVLLLGYSYAHLSTARFSLRRQMLVHLVVLCLPLLLPLALPFPFEALPFAITKGTVQASEDQPELLAVWIPWLLFKTVFLPFFVLSTSAPLLQKWFAQTGHPSAKDPYFLYAASNVGSMLALLGYPTIIEPLLSLKAVNWLESQSGLWTIGYGVFAVLVLVCAAATWLSAQDGKTVAKETAERQSSEPTPHTPDSGIRTLVQRLRWIALAFVPSSLMLGATTHITVDVSAIPLLWVIPLALYLLSFILVFSKWGRYCYKPMALLTPLIILLLIYATFTDLLRNNIAFIIPAHFATLFAVAMLCHGELARTRPSTDRLTEFYLLMSLGGVLGGLFNALVAPLVFKSVVEYPLALVFACFLVPKIFPERASWLSRRLSPRMAIPARIFVDLAFAAVVGGLLVGLIRLFYFPWEFPNWLDTPRQGVDRLTGWELPYSSETFRKAVDNFSVEVLRVYPPQVWHFCMFGLPLLLCYAYVNRALRFGLAIAIFFWVAGDWSSHGNRVLVDQDRSFFGVVKVQDFAEGEFFFRSLVHGTTLHGMQYLDEEHRRVPTSYFDLTGPIGELFRALQGPRLRNIGVMGLGAGTLAAYALPGQYVTFYDIDRLVIEKSKKYFSFFQDCRGTGRIVLGDARLKIFFADDGQYQLLFMDAFSSDSIPIHLVTKEALELYFRKMSQDGVLVVNVSNRYVDLLPVLGNLAEELGLVGYWKQDWDVQDKPGKRACDFAVLTRRRENVARLVDDFGWQPLPTNPRIGVWTDDYSNLLRAFKVPW